MIIVKLKGGLGNQMFQYACGRALALRNNDILKLDISGYSKDNTRKYCLDLFNIVNDIASHDEIETTKYPYGYISKLHWTLSRLWVRASRRFNIRFNHKIMKLRGDAYLDGFWQSERYFVEYEDVIRKDFALRRSLGERARSICENILHDKCPVSIHIRRGDKVSNPSSVKHHNILSREYYASAIGTIASRSSEPLNLYVFSDDIDWVKQNIKTKFVQTIVSQEGIADCEEMTLMSICRHHIISNSTFSWWGAWLDPHKDKIVVAPKQWVRTHMENYKDIIPKTWIRL